MPVIKKNGPGGDRTVASAAHALDQQVAAAGGAARQQPRHAASQPITITGRVLRNSTAQDIRAFELDLPDLRVAGPEPDTNPSPELKDRADSVPSGSVDALLAARDQEWEQRMERNIEAARKEAYALGYRDASSQLQSDFDARKQELFADIAALRTKWDDFLVRMEPLLAGLSFEIAQSVLDAPLPPKVRNVATRAITEAVEQMGGSTPIEILIHPVDFLRLQESGIVDQLESLHSGLRWEPRPDMKHGDWIVQSPSMAVRRLEEELLTSLKSRLGLLAVVEKERTQNKTPDGTPPQPE